MQYELDDIPDDHVPVAVGLFHQHLGTIAAQGPHGRRCQGKKDLYSLTKTGERLSEVVKSFVR